MRSNLYGYLGNYMPQMAQAGETYAAGLNKAAANPGWTGAASNANANIAGQYLNGSPQVDRAAAANTAAAEGDAANQTAREKSEYARNGMNFGTGQQEAAQSAQAQAAARAGQQNNQLYLQNYQAERANQNAGGAQLQGATSAPLNYLGGVSGAYAQPLAQSGNLLSGLSSGGQVYTQNSQGSGTYSPSFGQNIMSGMGSL
jgi:hypothetical protein